MKIFVSINLVVFIVLFILNRYKKCPPDRIIVVYGKELKPKCVYGERVFVWPIIQRIKFLDLRPISLEAKFINISTRENKKINIHSKCTVEISTELETMENAANYLVDCKEDYIKELVQDIIYSELKLLTSTFDIEEINHNINKFMEKLSNNMKSELKKIGLKLININIKLM